MLTMPVDGYVRLEIDSIILRNAILSRLCEAQIREI